MEKNNNFIDHDSSRFKLNKKIQHICFALGIVLMSGVTILYVAKMKRLDFIKTYVLIPGKYTVNLLIIYIAYRYITEKKFKSSCISIDSNIQSKPLIILDTIIRSILILLIGYFGSGLIIVFWVNLLFK